MPPTFAGRERYIGSLSTQAAFQLATGNFASNAAAAAAFHRVFPVDNRGFIASFFGTGADNSTADYRIWLFRGLTSLRTVSPADFQLEYLGGGTITLGTLAGAAGTIIPATEGGSTIRIADTLTFTLGSATTTPRGPATVLQNALALGDITAYSPGNNECAMLVAPHVPAQGVIIEFDLTGATGIDAVIERTG